MQHFTQALAHCALQIGKPITGSPTGLTLISERAPTAKSYLGAFQGYSRLNPVAQLVAVSRGSRMASAELDVAG